MTASEVISPETRVEGITGSLKSLAGALPTVPAVRKNRYVHNYTSYNKGYYVTEDEGGQEGYYKVFGPWVEMIDRNSVSAVHAYGYRDKDIAALNRFIAVLDQLAGSGNNRQALAADQLATSFVQKLLQAKHGVSSIHGIVEYKVDGILDTLKTYKDAKSIDLQKTLRFAPEVPAKLAAVLSTSQDEDFFVPFDVNIKTKFGVNTKGSIKVGKNGVSASFAIGDFEHGSPDNPINDLIKNNPVDLKSQVSNLFKNPGVTKGAFFFSEAVAAVVKPTDPRQQAINARYGIAAADSLNQPAIHSDTISYISQALKQMPNTEVDITETDIDGQKVPTLIYRTEKAAYRVTVQSSDGGSVLNISPIPITDNFRRTEERIIHGFESIDKIMSLFTSYVGDKVITPGLIMLSAEHEKSAKVDLVELGKQDLVDDIDHIGGLPPITRSAIENFIAGTIAYSSGDSQTKPNNIMLTGETGTGKSTVCRAVAKEFAKSGIPVYRVAPAEPINAKNLVRVLLTFQNDPNGGALIIDDFEDWLKGTYAQTTEARATLLQALNAINASQTHMLILNTEHPETVMGEREALLQTHRIDTVPCQLELSNGSIEDLLRAMIARLTSSPQADPVKKNDPVVDQQMQRLLEGRDLSAFINELLAIAGQYHESAPLSPGVVVGAFKAADWENNNTDAIKIQLERILDEKGKHRTQARLAEGESDQREMMGQLTELREMIHGLNTTVDQMAAKIGVLEKQQLRMKSTTPPERKETVGTTPANQTNPTKHRIGGKNVV